MRAPAAALTTLVVLCSFAAARTSQAEPRDPAAAEALFAEGRTLLKQGRLAEACPKFEASQRLDPANGTLMNLAECYEKSGRLASAWVTFRDAAAGAASAGQAARAAHARTRAADVEPRLCRLRVDVDRSVEQPVFRDDVALDRAVFGQAIPIDPGRYAILVRDGNAVVFRREVEVAPRADGSCATVVVAVPSLGPSHAAATHANANASSNSAAPNSLESTSAPSPDVSASGWTAARPLALAAVGVGIVGIGAGSFLGLRAKSTWDEARSKCTPNGCGDEAQSLASTARQQAGIGTVSFLAGATVVAGAVVWILAPSAKRSVGLAPVPGGLFASGRF